MLYVTPGLTDMLRHQVSMFYLHTYTRTPRSVLPDNTSTPGVDESLDAWGEQVYVPASPLPLRDCLYLEEGQTFVGPNGLIEVVRPTLLVPYTDPIQEGDQVRDVKTKPSSPYIQDSVVLVLGPVLVDEVTLIAPEFGGALYKTALMRQAADI